MPNIFSESTLAAFSIGAIVGFAAQAFLWRFIHDEEDVLRVNQSQQLRIERVVESSNGKASIALTLDRTNIDGQPLGVIALASSQENKENSVMIKGISVSLYSIPENNFIITIPLHATTDRVLGTVFKSQSGNELLGVLTEARVVVNGLPNLNSNVIEFRIKAPTWAVDHDDPS